MAAFTYTDFSSVDGLNLVGTAALSGTALRVTPAAVDKKGAIWFAQKQFCKTGFTTSFRFRISQLGSQAGLPPGGDGFSFSVQNACATALGSEYGAETNLVSADSLNVSFNTYYNPGSEPSDNFVGITTNGDRWLIQKDLNGILNMSDGAEHQVQITFKNQVLDVFIDGKAVITNFAAPLTRGLDASGYGWVGFGARTGWAYEAHDILNWSFSSESPIPPCTPAPTGLVSWWQAESNALDSVDGNAGTLAGGAGFGTGRAGRGFVLDGVDDAVIVPNAASLNFGAGQDFSLEAWIAPQPSSSYYGVMSIVDKRLSPSWTADIGYEFNLEYGQIHFRMSDSLVGPSHGFGPAGPDLRDGQLHHVAVSVTRNSATGGKLYVDGQAVLTFDPTVASGDLSNTQPFQIGKGANSTFFSNYKGSIDELSVYRRALSAAEIQAIYTAAGAGKCYPLPVNRAPVAQCSNLTVVAGVNCLASASINSGSYDPDGDPIVVTQSPPGPYPLGTNLVSLVVTDNKGATNMCNGQVIVLSQLPPLNYPDFSSTAGLSLVGVSSASAGVLQLTPAAYTVVGTAWATAKQACSRGFETTFQFRMRNQGALGGGDGITFTIQTNGPTDPTFHTLLSPADGSVSVFFNSFWNWPDSVDFTRWDVSGNSVGVISNALYLSQTDLNPRGVNLKDGAIHEARIKFDGMALTVWLDGAVVLSNVSVPGLASAVDAAGNAWVGFGSTTGGAWEIHEILSWSFVGSSCNAAPIARSTDVTLAAGINCLAQASVDDGSFDPDGDAIIITQVPPGPYPLGTNAVTLTVTDSKGASNSCIALVIVQDRTPPLLVCASNKVVECGAAWSFDTPAASDTCGPVSVSILGTVTNAGFAATRTWEARDSATNTATCSQTVTVVDTVPPTVVCPAPRVLEFQDETGAKATFTVTANDGCSAVNLSVAPVSGSVFPFGQTTVLAQATDVCSNTTQCSFTVTVLGAQGVKSNVLAELTALRVATPLNQSFAQKFDEAIQHLADSLNPDYWIDQIHLQARGGNAAMNEEKLCAKTLADILEAKGCPVTPGLLQGFVDRIVKCDRLLAVICVREAARAGLNPKKVAQDLAMVAKGDEEVDKGHYANAIEHYRNAWRHALQLQLQVTRKADGSALVRFVGSDKQAYVIEASSDMVHWAPVGHCAADHEGNVEFNDPGSANQSMRFYRAVEE